MQPVDSPQHADRPVVLIMEDDFDLRDQWTAVLELQGAEVEVATNRLDAEHLIRHRRIDVVITDVFVESDAGDARRVQADGLTLIAHLRTPELNEYPRWASSVPIIAVTGSSNKHGFDVLEHATHMGATIALRKPIQPERLAESVAALATERPHGAPEN